MKIICFCCGEYWEVDHVLYDQPEAFERTGADIRQCPCCQGVRPDNLPKEFGDRLDLMAQTARECANVSAYARFLKDFF